MKKLPLILCLFLAPAPALLTSCSTPANERVAAVQTLKSIGQAAEAAVGLTADLYRDRKISAEQARAVMDFYNGTFQPAFRIAKGAARDDLSAVAAADLIALGAKLTTLVQKLHSP